MRRKSDCWDSVAGWRWWEKKLVKKTQSCCHEQLHEWNRMKWEECWGGHGVGAPHRGVCDGVNLMLKVHAGHQVGCRRLGRNQLSNRITEGILQHWKITAPVSMWPPWEKMGKDYNLLLEPLQERQKGTEPGKNLNSTCVLKQGAICHKWSISEIQHLLTRVKWGLSTWCRTPVWRSPWCLGGGWRRHSCGMVSDGSRECEPVSKVSSAEVTVR